MDPLQHFIKKLKNDTWSNNRGEVRCVGCGRKTLRSQTFLIPGGTKIYRESAVKPIPSIQPKRRVFSIRPSRTPTTPTYTTTSDTFVCATCARDTAPQRAVRGEPPEYFPKYLSPAEKKMLK